MTLILSNTLCLVLKLYQVLLVYQLQSKTLSPHLSSPTSYSFPTFTPPPSTIPINPLTSHPHTTESHNPPSSTPLSPTNHPYRYLLAERTFTTIDVFEQRSDAGGVWRYTAENDTDASFTIPSTNPGVGLEKPFWRVSDETSGVLRKGDGKLNGGVNGSGGVDGEGRKPTFISPL